MECQSLPIAYPVSRTPARRLIDELRSSSHRLAKWWQRWMKQREDDSALQTLAHLDARTLKDIGMPEEFRSRVAALREARNERLGELMR
jgi:chemotaxis regulatin CheY-phosphate phosphatase CheZ